MARDLSGQAAQLVLNGFDEPINLVNLTGHEITMWADDGMVRLKPSGCVARCEYRRIPAGELRIGKHSVAVTRTIVDGVRDLPPPRPGVYYVVSLMVASVARDRGDLLVLDSPIKDEHGATVAIRSLTMAAAADLPEFQRREHAAQESLEVVGEDREVGDGTVGHSTHHIVGEEDRNVRVRPTMPFHAWHAVVAAAVEERTGRPADRITADWQTLHAKGRTPQEAVDDVLGGDVFGELMEDGG